MGNDKAKVATPVDLIVANTTHETLGAIEEAQDAIAKISEAIQQTNPGMIMPEFNPKDEQFVESYARQLLCNIAHRATLGVVRKALAALGCPSESDEIWARIDAAREVQRREAEIAPATH